MRVKTVTLLDKYPGKVSLALKQSKSAVPIVQLRIYTPDDKLAKEIVLKDAKGITMQDDLLPDTERF